MPHATAYLKVLLADSASPGVSEHPGRGWGKGKGKGSADESVMCKTEQHTPEVLWPILLCRGVMGCVQMLCLRQLFDLEEDSIADEGVWEEPSSSAHRRLCVGDTFLWHRCLGERLCGSLIQM